MEPSSDWNSERRVLRSSDGEEFPLTVTRGCPELDESQALELISRLEAKQLQELRSHTASTARLVKVAKMSWWTALLEYVDTGENAAADLMMDKAAFLFGVDASRRSWVPEQTSGS